jgi:hypothetical protein
MISDRLMALAANLSGVAAKGGSIGPDLCGALAEQLAEFAERIAHMEDATLTPAARAGLSTVRGENG